MTAALTVFSFLLGFFPPLSIAAANVALAGFCLLLLVACLSGRETFLPARTPMDGAVLAFLAVWALSAVFGMDPAKSLGKLPSQLRLAVFYLLVWAGGGRYRSAAFKGFLWGAGVAVAYGTLQFAVDRAGLSDRVGHLFAALGPGDRYGTLREGRAHGAMHPLTYAEVILPFFLLGVAFLVEADRRGFWRGLLWVWAAGQALLLCQSRGPWLGAAVGLAALLAWGSNRPRLAAVMLLIALEVLASGSLRRRMKSFYPEPEDGSRSHRIILWHNTWQVARRRWALGVGTGNLRHGVEAYREEPGFLPNPEGKDGDAHNEYLQHLAERGVPGLAALIGIMAAAVVLSIRSFRSPPEGAPPRWALLGLVGFFLAWPIVNITERAYDDAEPALIFWTLASLAVPVKGRPGADPSVKGSV